MDGGEPVRAVLDANVLYSAFIRDVLLRLATADLYLPCWSEHIHEEWMRNLLAHRPDLAESNLLRTRAAMDAFFPDALVAGYESMETRFRGVDPKDRHVAAAALKAQASHVVTRNLRDFPPATLSVHGISACTPDDFIQMLAAEHPNAVRDALEAHRSGLRRPRLSREEYRAAFVRNGLLGSAALLLS